MLVLETINNFLYEHPLCVVFKEIATIKNLLQDHGGELKLRQKSSSVTLVAKGGTYFFKAKISVPDNYPNSCVR